MKKPSPPKDLWEQMDSMVGPPRQNSEGFTLAEYCARYNTSLSQSRRKLHAMVAEGKIIKGERKMASGYWATVYRPA